MDIEFCKTVGSNIARRREELRLSQKKLAARCREATGYIKLVENGDEDFSILLLGHIAYELDISPSKLIE